MQVLRLKHLKRQLRQLALVPSPTASRRPPRNTSNFKNNPFEEETPSTEGVSPTQDVQQDEEEEQNGEMDYL